MRTTTISPYANIRPLDEVAGISQALKAMRKAEEGVLRALDKALGNSFLSSFWAVWKAPVE
jgi:hypothetical protein